jgi:hypothetical protein
MWILPAVALAGVAIPTMQSVAMVAVKDDVNV